VATKECPDCGTKIDTPENKMGVRIIRAHCTRDQCRGLVEFVYDENGSPVEG
jgi:hypothetical protein